MIAPTPANREALAQRLHTLFEDVACASPSKLEEVFRFVATECDVIAFLIQSDEEEEI